MFGLKEIGSESSGTVSLFGLCALVLQSPVISVVTAVQWAECQWEKKLVGGAPPPPLVTQIDQPANRAFYSSSQIAARSETRPKKDKKCPRYKCGKLVGSGETAVGAPVSRVLPRGAPVGRTGTSRTTQVF